MVSYNLIFHWSVSCIFLNFIYFLCHFGCSEMRLKSLAYLHFVWIINLHLIEAWHALSLKSNHFDEIIFCYLEITVSAEAFTSTCNWISIPTILCLPNQLTEISISVDNIRLLLFFTVSFWKSMQQVVSWQKFWRLSHHRLPVLHHFFICVNVGDYFERCLHNVLPVLHHFLFTCVNVGDYVSFIAPVASGVDTEITKHPCGNENGFLKENYSSQDESAKKEDLPVASTSENSKWGISVSFAFRSGSLWLKCSTDRMMQLQKLLFAFCTPA